MDERIKKIESLFLKADELSDIVRQRDKVESILCGEPMAADDVERLFVALQGVAFDQSFHLLRAVFQHDDDEFKSKYKKYNNGKSFAEGASECLGDSGFKEISEGVAKAKAKSIKIDKSENAIKYVNGGPRRVATNKLKEVVLIAWGEVEANYPKGKKHQFVRDHGKVWRKLWEDDYKMHKNYFPQDPSVVKWLPDK